MRQSRIANIDLPLQAIKEASVLERHIKEDIRQHRERTTISGRDPHAESRRPWKVRDARQPGAEPPPAPITWEWEFNERNTVSKLTQLSPDPAPSIDSQPQWLGRKFKVRVTEGCGGPRGLSLAVGCLVECFADLAFSLQGVGRGTIEEEFAA